MFFVPREHPTCRLFDKSSEFFLDRARRAETHGDRLLDHKCVCAVQQRYKEAVCQGLDPRGDFHYKTTISYKNMIQIIQRARSEHSVLDTV